jgi:ADP-ribosylation factor-like protein 2
MSVSSIIRKMQQKDREIRLLILGLDNAGKTTVLQRFLGQGIDQISPTVGFNIKTTQYMPPSSSTSSPSSPLSATSTPLITPTTSPATPTTEHPYTVTIWDIGGQSTIRSFWSNYFSHTDGLIWVIDSTDISRFDLCIETLRQVLKQERLSGVSLLILANKQDVQFAYSLAQIAQLLGLTPTTAIIPNNNDNTSISPSTINQPMGYAVQSLGSKPQNLTSGGVCDDNDDNGESQPEPIGAILSHHWLLHGCSARANVGIKEAFDEFLLDIINRLYLLG